MVYFVEELEENLTMAHEQEPLEDLVSLTADLSTNGSLKHGERIASFSELKKNSRSMCEFLKDQKRYNREYIALAGCANYLVFHDYYTVDEIRLAKIRTCKNHMLCQFCARMRAAKQANVYLEKFIEVKNSNPDLIPAMITLTVANGHNMKERFEHLSNSFKKFQKKRNDFKNKNIGFNEFCKIEGAVFAYEQTKSDSGYHPHIHMAVLLNDYIDVKKLSKEWLKITGDSKIIDVRKLSGKNDEELGKSFLEVFKYSLKFSDFSKEEICKVYSTLKGKRLQGSFGNLWGVKIPDTDTDELLDLPYLEKYYKYSNKSESYSMETCKKFTEQIDIDYREYIAEQICNQTGEVTEEIFTYETDYSDLVQRQNELIEFKKEQAGLMKLVGLPFIPAHKSTSGNIAKFKSFRGGVPRSRGGVLGDLNFDMFSDPLDSLCLKPFSKDEKEELIQRHNELDTGVLSVEGLYKLPDI